MRYLYIFLLFLSLLNLGAQDWTLAVLYFDTSSGESPSISESEKNAVGKALTEMIISDLSQLQILTLVERENLNLLIEEQQLALSGLLDESTAVKAGELLGARYLLSGDLLLTGQLVTLSARIQDVQSGEILASMTESGEVSQVFLLQEALIEELIHRWDIPLSRQERDLLSHRDNISLEGLIRFGNALNASDDGDYQRALSYLQAAVEISPDFQLAQKMIEEIQQRFDLYIHARDEELPLEILDKIDILASSGSDMKVEQDLLKMYWAFIQPLTMGMSYYGTWASMPDPETKEYIFENTIQPSWAQMGLQEEPESIEELEDYLGRKIYIAHEVLEYILEKDLALEGFQSYFHPVEGMMGYFLTPFASLSSAPDWQFPPMINPQGEVVMNMDQYYHILLRYCDMFLNNFPYSSYNGMVTPMMAVLLDKTS